MSTIPLTTLAVAPRLVQRGRGILPQAVDRIMALGSRPLLVGGAKTLERVTDLLPAYPRATYHPDCSGATLKALHQAAEDHQANVVVGVGGGKALDAAKLLAHQRRVPVVTIPTSAATCAAWTALANVYSDQGAFLYDVALDSCPDLLLLDYTLVQTAPPRTLVAGIGDALAKWYEASISSAHSSQTLVTAAVQQARVLRDLLLQQSLLALQEPGGSVWEQVVDATVLLAGVMGGLGGAPCRTVAAHAVHNGLTHLLGSHGRLHGEKVAYGVLVQLRLEELVQGSILAQESRSQLLRFYRQVGLPCTWAELGLGEATEPQLRTVAQVACAPGSDLHRLPFPVSPETLWAALVSTDTKADTSARHPSRSS